MADELGMADRIRSALAHQPVVREVKMFGGLAFMVNEAMVVSVGSTGDLLVRVDPERSEDHLRVKVARFAEMGAGRTMGRGWLTVDAGAVAADEDLAYWIDAALAFHSKRAGRAQEGEGGTATAFRGFPPELFAFYDGLGKDNSTAYWEAHRATWTDKVRDPMKALLAELAAEFRPLRMFRPNRDLRFAKDRSPYRLRVGATSESQAVGGIGYYVHVEASGLVAGYGAMRMAPDQLQRFRTAIDEDGSGRQFERLTTQLAGRSLPVTSGAEPPRKTMPPGFSTAHPRAAFLRWRGAAVVREYGNADWMSTRQVLDVIRDVWRGADPLREWMDAQVVVDTATAR